MTLLYVFILVGIVGIALGVYFLTQDTRESYGIEDIPELLERITEAQKKLEKLSEAHSSNS